MKPGRQAVGVLFVAALFACGNGNSTPDAGADAGPFAMEDGLYQLATFALDGDCKSDGIVSPTAEYVGKAVPVMITATPSSVAVQVCGFEGDSPDCGAAGDAFDFSMARDGNRVFGQSANWAIPGCGCTTFDGTATFEGTVSAPSAATLAWDIAITAPDQGCVCDGYAVCTGTMEHRLSR